MIYDKLGFTELAYFKELFNAMDKDSEGSITSKELGTALASIGAKATDMEVQAMINEGDSDGNGILDFEEFVELLGLKLCLEMSIDDYRDAFRIIDKDNNGFVSTAELRAIYIALGIKISDEEVEEMIREADLDADGVVTFEEFEGMMTSLRG